MTRLEAAHEWANPGDMGARSFELSFTRCLRVFTHLHCRDGAFGSVPAHVYPGLLADVLYYELSEVRLTGDLQLSHRFLFLHLILTFFLLPS